MQPASGRQDSRWRTVCSVAAEKRTFPTMTQQTVQQTLDVENEE